MSDDDRFIVSILEDGGSLADVYKDLEKTHVIIQALTTNNEDGIDTVLHTSLKEIIDAVSLIRDLHEKLETYRPETLREFLFEKLNKEEF